MTDQSETARGSGHKTEFQLNILSPSPQVGRLNFPSISTSCTVAQLKQRISDASESKVPLPGQQRLIYRGRVLAQEARTLGEVFGQETIDDSNEPLTIHLAFNPAAPQGSTAANSSSHTRPTTPQPTRTTPVPGIQPSAPQNGIQATHGVPFQPQPGHGPNGSVPVLPQPQFPAQLQQTFALMNQQIAAQMAALGANPMVQNMAPNQPQGQAIQVPHQHQPQQPHVHHTHGHVHQPQMPPGVPHMNPNLSQQALQQYMAHQNQLRIAAGQQGTNMAAQRPNSAPPPGMGNTNTVIRETYGPNGERHQSIVSSGTIQINHGAQGHNMEGLRRRESSRNASSRSGTPIAQINPPSQGEHPGIVPPTALSSMQLQALQAHMASMESAMNLGSIPPDSIREQTRSLLQSVAPTINQQQYQMLESRRQTLSNRADAMQGNLDAQLHRAAEQVASQRQSSNDSAIYLLSSPSGPQALLISPSGYFAAPWPMASAAMAQPTRVPDLPNINAAQNAVVNAQQAQINTVPLAQAQPNAQRHINAVEGLQGPQQQQQQQQEAQAQNQARDIVRILIPLGGHLWLLIRLFGFVYFFTHGASWQRTILLSLVAFLLFVAQTGIFQPLLQTVWGPIRRHAEALLPLAGNEQPRRGGAPAPANANAAGPQGRNREPTPQEAAERLLREREAHDGNFIRQGLRRLERAVALFVASLVPGVGERHIAAREAAEAARQREEREREERARQEEVERQQAQATMNSANSADANGENSPSAAGESSGRAPSGQEDQTPEPPLIEV